MVAKLVALVALLTACGRPTEEAPAVARLVDVQAPALTAGCVDPAAMGALPVQPWMAVADYPDSRRSIQAAVDLVTARGGGVVCLGPGRWYVTRSPAGTYDRFAAVSTHQRGLELAGAGAGQTTVVIAGDAGASTFWGIALDPGAADVVIRDLTIDTSELTNTDSGEQTHAIVVGSGNCTAPFCVPTENVTIQRVRFNHGGSGRWGDCVRVAGNTPATEARNVRLVDLDFQRCGRSGVTIQRNANALTIAHSYFNADGIGGSPIDGEATGGGWDDGLVIDGNQIYRRAPGGDSYLLSLTSQRHFAVTNNVMVGGRGCISAVRMSDGVIADNVCSVVDGQATVAAVDLANASTSVVISGNAISRSGAAAPLVKAVPHSGVYPGPLVVTGNALTSDSDGAVVLLGGAQGSVVASNSIAGPGLTNSVGVYAYAQGSHLDGTAITGNSVRGAAYAPVLLGGTTEYGLRSTVVSGNTSRSSGPGVRCTNVTPATSAGGLVVTGNSWSTAATCSSM